MKNYKQQSILVLEGTPYNRGLIHGETLKQEIHEIIGLWKENLSNRLKSDINKYFKKFYERTDFITTINKWTPGLLDEIKGLSNGSGIDYDTILTFQFLDELWLSIEKETLNHCSSMGFNSTNKTPVCIAQNLDIESFRDNYQIVFHVKNLENNLEIFLLSSAGLIGMNGMNSNSIGICCNCLSQLKFNNIGLPVAFVVRGLLEQQTEADALNFIKNIKHASGQNYIVGTQKNVYDFECSTNKVIEFKSKNENSSVCHTNHPLVNNDYKLEYKKMDDKSKLSYNLNSNERYKSLKNRSEKISQKDRFSEIKNTLMAKDSVTDPICSTIGDGSHSSSWGIFTFASTIMILSEVPELHVNYAPADIDNYQILKF
ncbi:MAG TPA: C45 family peptidase [Victivallales bacterium]|nr:C45 family peptidase [Victivallales bacterium]